MIYCKIKLHYGTVNKLLDILVLSYTRSSILVQKKYMANKRLLNITNINKTILDNK